MKLSRRVLLGVSLSAVAICAAFAGTKTDDEFSGVVSRVQGAAKYKNSHFDKSPKPVSKGLVYYSGFEFMAPKGASYELQDLNAKKSSLYQGDGKWNRVVLELNPAQTRMVSRLSSLEWSISRGEASVEVPSKTSRAPAGQMLILRSKDNSKSPIKVSVYAQGNPTPLAVDNLKPGETAHFLKPLGLAVAGKDVIVTMQLEAGGKQETRLVRILSTEAEQKLNSKLAQYDLIKNRLTRLLERASVYAEAGCTDLCAYTLTGIEDQAFDIPALSSLRSKPYSKLLASW